MKKFLFVFLAILTVFTGCAKQTDKNEAGTTIANPMSEVQDAQAFADKVGRVIDAPVNATDVQYFTIDVGSYVLAHVTFSYKGADYTYRCAKTADDISGLNVTFENVGDYAAQYQDGQKDYSLMKITGDDGGYYVTWTWGDYKYTLYAAGGANEDDFISVAESLIQSSYQV